MAAAVRVGLLFERIPMAKQDVSAAALIDHNAARAILEGRCGDPFAQLGLQQRQGTWLLTVFVPGVDGIDCLTGKKTVKPLEPLPAYPGLFVGTFARRPKYRLRGHVGAHRRELDDP